MDAPAQAAVGGGHDPLGADQGREALDAVGHELGVLQHVGGVGDDAGDEVLALGQGHVPPDPPLVLVADVGRLEAQPVGVHAQGQVDDLVEAEVGGVRAVPRAPAHVVAHPGGVDAPQGVVEGLDAHGGEAAVVLQVGGDLELVPGLGQVGGVDLDGEPGAGDRQVLLAQGLGPRPHGGLVVLVVVVADAGGGRGADGGEEALLDGPAGPFQRRLEGGDVALDDPPARVGQLAGDRRDDGRRGARQVDAAGGVGVGVGVGDPVAPGCHGVELEPALGGGAPGGGGPLGVDDLQAAEALEGVEPPGAVVDLLGHGVTVLAVVDDAQADVRLPGDDGVGLGPHDGGQAGVVQAALGVGGVGLQEVVGARQGADVGGADLNGHGGPVVAVSRSRVCRR